MSDYEDIHQVLLQYYEGLYQCDTDLLGQVFHPEAHYSTASSGDLLHMNMQTYFEILKDRTSPKSRGDVPYLKIENIELAGPVMAFSRLRCHMLDNAYTDFLTLHKLGGRWQIISKSFHVEPLSN